LLILVLELIPDEFRNEFFLQGHILICIYFFTLQGHILIYTLGTMIPQFAF